MLQYVCCDECGKRSTEVENIVTLFNICVCNECVVILARRIGLLPSARSDEQPRPPLPREEAEPPMPASFIFSAELDGHLNQPFDISVMQTMIVILKAEYPEIAIDLARVERIDGFDPGEVAEGRARYLVDLLIRTQKPVSPYSWRLVLDQKWSQLARINRRLLGDKGTRDLVEPRIMQLITYILSRAAVLGWIKGMPPGD